MRDMCGCLPFNIKLFHKVHGSIINYCFKMPKCPLYIFQETLCSSPQELDCVKNMKVDTSSCLKPCSGLVVTSFAKSELKTDLEALFPILGDYSTYKKLTSHPSGANGN